MIPSLRNKDDSKLIGTLNDVIYGYVIEERNGNFECELQYPIFSENWDKLVEENIIVADASDTLKAQKFRIYKTTKPMNGIFTVYALHISFDTAKDMIDDIVVENQSCEYCLNKIFASSQFSQKYKGYSDIINSQSFSIKSTKVLSSIAGESGSILDTFGIGAEILRDNYDFHVLNSRGHDNDVTIEYGKNLKDINFEVDTSSMITRIKPYAIYTDEAGNEITVYSNPKYVDSPNINNYATPYTESIDFSDKFGDDEIPTSAKLIYLAEKYFIDNNCDQPKISIKISFIPLSKCIGYEDLKDKISLCDTVTIIDSRYNYKDKAKVVKATYDFISERYESMEIGEPRTTLGNIIGGSGDSNKGEQGPPGPQGPPGADGNIGDFPDTLPITPTLSSTLHGFANIELSWTFEDKIYYTYELYASKIKNFTPSIFDAIFIGKASSFLFQAKPDETWYFRVCCVNSYGKRTEFSSQIAVTTIKIDDLSNYVDNAAIGEALIGTLSLDRGWVGTLKGNYIDAKQLSVTDGNGKRTLYVDSFGHVYLDVAELKISSKQAATYEDVDDLVIDLQHQIDGKIETYSQSTDPSTYWTTEDVKLQHEGDLWYNTSSLKTYRWNGTSWVYQPEAEELAKSKKRIFSTTPTVPYDVGDLWILQSDTAHSAGKKGEILTCSTAKISGSYSSSDWKKTITYTDDSYAVSVESKLEQRADEIELSVTEIKHNAYDIIANGDFSDTSTTNWVSSNITKLGPVTSNSKRWLRLYNTTETITNDAICSCEFTLKHDVTYSFNLLVAQRLSSRTFYRVTVDGFNSDVRGWQTVKTWTGTTMGTTASPTKLTYSYTYPTGSAFSKFRLAVKRLTSDPVMDIYITGISITCKDSLVKTSQIKVLSDSIESKVSRGDIGTLIQQNATSVKIAWNNISKYVQFENGEIAIYNGSVETSQKRATFDENGNHFWRDGYYLGKIGTNKYASDNSIKGINFDLEYQGGYMTWAVKKTSTASNYTMMWSYANTTVGNYQAGKLHAGADIDMHNYYLRNVNFEGGGITGTMNFVQILAMDSDGTANKWSNGCKMQFQNGILISATWSSL